MSELHDAVLHRLGALIRKHGWALQHVGGGSGLPWTYTVGLSDVGLRELVLVGVEYNTAGWVLNTIAEACRSGIEVTNPEALRIVFGHPRVFLQVRPVDPSWYATSLFNIAGAYFGSVPEASQVVMADKEGRFPWDAGHHLGGGIQPALWVPYPGGWPDEESP